MSLCSPEHMDQFLAACNNHEQTERMVSTTHMTSGALTFCGEELYGCVDGEPDRDHPLVSSSVERSKVNCQTCLNELDKSNAAWAERRARHGVTRPTHISFEIPITAYPSAY